MTDAVESADDLAVFFNADEFGVSASYAAPGGGAATPCVVTIDRRDPGDAMDEGRPPVGTKVLEVPADVLASPEHRGTFTFAAPLPPGLSKSVWTISNRPQASDFDGRIWRMWIE